MKTTVKEARETTIYVIDHNNHKVVEETLLDFVMQSAEEVCSPRGVTNRIFANQAHELFLHDKEDLMEFMESEGKYIYLTNEHRFLSESDFEEVGEAFSCDLFTISDWGRTGNNYQKGTEMYLTKEEAEDVIFQRTYEFDFQKDDQRDIRFFDTKEEAENELIEMLSYDWGVDEDVVRSILKKEKLVEDIKLERKKKRDELRKIQREKEDEILDSVAEIYSLMIEPKFEGYMDTAKRLSEKLTMKVDSKVFHRAVKMVRGRFVS
jgi:hypothetical protein